MKKPTALLVILSLWGVLAESQEKSVPHYRYPDAITMMMGGSSRMFPKTRSAPLSSVTVDSVRYDESMGQTVITVTNASNRNITAFALDLPPGTSMYLLIEEFLGGSSGAFHPGETVDIHFGEEMRLDTLPIPSVVVYSDVTAESTNSSALERIKAYRESIAAAYERAVELSATIPDPEKLADELQAESDPPQEGHGMPPLIKKKPETPDKPPPDPQAKTSDNPTPDLAMLHQIAQQLIDGQSIQEIREQAAKWRTHSKIEGGAAEKKE